MNAAAGDQLYITITTKPLSIAAAEGLPAVSSKILVGDITADDLLLIIQAAKARLEKPHGDR